MTCCYEDGGYCYDEFVPEDRRIEVLAIVGQTGTGKTKLSINLAKYLSGDIVSADSVQVYKHLNIGTAKPTNEELGKILYYLVDFVEPEYYSEFSVYAYVDCAKEIIRKIKWIERLPIICGGTGLYVDALLSYSSFSTCCKDTRIRKELEESLYFYGKERLFKKLEEVDPASAKKIHPNNVKRIIRALECYLITGQKFSEAFNLKSREYIYYPVYVGLMYKNKENLVNVINKRVDCMIEGGLVDETKELLNNKKFKKILNNVIGYKELVPYINGEVTLDYAVERIKIDTRKYAKRQMTWFKRNQKIKWFYVDEEDCFDGLLFNVKKYVKKELEEVKQNIKKDIKARS